MAFLSGVDPYETKTTLFTQWMMPGDKKMIFVTPHQTMGVAWALREGRGLWLPVNLGTDTVLHMAIARIILENNWQDQEFIEKWIAKPWDVDSGYGRGTRNTGWQWRTTWGTWQSDWEDYKKFILSQEESKLDVAAGITGINPADIRKAAEWIAKPKADGSRPKASFMLEKGNYWSNNYMNTTSLASLGLICGSGNRPGRVISRGGGHQRGMVNAGGGSGWLSPEKHPGRRKKSLNLDRWLMAGEVKFAWVFGTTWVAAMMASDSLGARMKRTHPRQPQPDHQPRPQGDLRGTEEARRFGRHGDGRFRHLSRASRSAPTMPTSSCRRRPGARKTSRAATPSAACGSTASSTTRRARPSRTGGRWPSSPTRWATRPTAATTGRTPTTCSRKPRASAAAACSTMSRWWPRPRPKASTATNCCAPWAPPALQTPIRERDGKLVGTQRLHDPANDWGEIEGTEVQGKWLYAFGTHSGKAILLKSPWKYAGWYQFFEAVKPRAEKGEIWVTNGRINESWQSGFDDRRKPHAQPSDCREQRLTRSVAATQTPT